MTQPTVSDASRLFCVGRNYAAHAREMAADRPTRPVLFHKPGSVRLPPGPVRLPADLGRVDFEGELTLLLSGNPEAPVAAVGLGVDLTLRDRQSELKQQQLPWDVAKAFDGSALLGGFLPWPPDAEADLAALSFETRINDEPRQFGRTRDMIFPVDQLLAELGRYWRLRPGDVVFTGTPEGVGPLADGDRIEMRGKAALAELGPMNWQLERR